MTWLKEGHIINSRIEPVGCFNTGTAPAVAHRTCSLYCNHYYIVGAVNDLQDPNIRKRVIRASKRDGKFSKRKFKGFFGPVYVYTTQASAKKRFEQLCNQAYDRIERDLAEARKLQEEAKNGDMKAAFSLSDMGLI